MIFFSLSSFVLPFSIMHSLQALACASGVSTCSGASVFSLTFS
jgi:hypothetical protein